MAEAGLRIRVDDTLRRDFIATCKANDTTAAQVLRAYMRSYLETHGAEVRQGKLFATPDRSIGNITTGAGRA